MFWYLRSDRYVSIAEWDTSGYELDYVSRSPPFSPAVSLSSNNSRIMSWLLVYTCPQERTCLSINTDVPST